MNTPEFYVCQKKDVRALQALARETFKTFAPLNTPKNYAAYVDVAFTENQLEEELTHPNSIFYFLRVAEQNIGYLKLNQEDAQQEDFGAAAMEIQRIYVLDAHRGKGYGQLMIQKAVEQAHTWKKSYIWLGVWEKNPRAIQFYQREGFEIFSAHDFQFGDELQKDLLLRKNL